MTKISHYIYSINQLNEEFVMVTFRQTVSTKDMASYLNKAKSDWKAQGLPGECPQSALNQIREDRFKNEFQMRFPFHEWSNRNLRINDPVEIDMPLRLEDIRTVKKETGE